jgi:ankyrin repeat protein
MVEHCQHCNKQFVNPSTLKRHNIAIHTGVRHEHRCTSCGTKFAREDALRRHTRTKHTLELMERCQFCLENFRKDYFARHKSRCGRKYWAKVCNHTSLTNQIQGGHLNDSNGSAVWRNISPDAEPVPATESSLRVVREIDIDVRLASEAFDVLFLHCWNTENIESCLEAITTSLRLSVPINTDSPDYDEIPPGDEFNFLAFLAHSSGEVVRGERDTNGGNYEASQAMNAACESGAVDLIEPLFWTGAELDEANLFLAIYSGSFYTVRFCLALGADPNHCSLRWYFGYSPLALALNDPGTKNSHIACLLIEYGATVFVRGYQEETPLHSAADRADVDFLRVLLAKDSSPAFLDATNNDGQRALDAAVESISSGIAEDRALEFVSALLDAGAEANGVDYQQSALSYAVVHDQGAIIRLLLDREPESPRKTQYLKEALMEAIDFGPDDTVQILVEAGASVDIKTLRIALRYDTLERVRLLLRAGTQAEIVGDDILESLFSAACDQRLSGTQGKFEWFDAMAKCKLLCQYFPNDQRLHELSASLGSIP